MELITGTVVLQRLLDRGIKVPDDLMLPLVQEFDAAIREIYSSSQTTQSASQKRNPAERDQRRQKKLNDLQQRLANEGDPETRRDIKSQIEYIMLGGE